MQGYQKNLVSYLRPLSPEELVTECSLIKFHHGISYKGKRRVIREILRFTASRLLPLKQATDVTTYG